LDQKKVAQLPPLRTTLLAPDPENPTSTILELDELWSFVLKKAHDSWMWIALCRKTRQVVAYAVGDRSKKTCQRLWEAIPQEYRQGHCFTDFLREAYSAFPFLSSDWIKSTSERSKKKPRADLTLLFVIASGGNYCNARLFRPIVPLFTPVGFSKAWHGIDVRGPFFDDLAKEAASTEMLKLSTERQSRIE
jgi:IS1 transposase